MNKINEINSIKFLVELNRSGLITTEERKKIRLMLSNYDNFKEFLLNIVATRRIGYNRIPEYLKKDYKFLKQACVANPRILRDIFFTSFHDLTEVVNLMSDWELLAVVNNKFAKLTPEIRNTILLNKGIKQNQTEKEQVQTI